MVVGLSPIWGRSCSDAAVRLNFRTAAKVIKKNSRAYGMHSYYSEQEGEIILLSGHTLKLQRGSYSTIMRLPAGSAKPLAIALPVLRLTAAISLHLSERQ